MTIDREALRRLFDHAAASGPDGSQGIAAACTEHLRVDGASVSVAGGPGTQTLVCATDEQSRRLAEAQTTTGGGPALDVLQHGVPVLVPDLHDPAQDAAGRWPGLLDMLHQPHARALFSLPVQVGVLTLGVLALYRWQPGAMAPDEQDATREAADAVAACLLAQNYRPTDADGALPWPSADAGVVVHQATGMVGVQLGTSMAGALLTLRARAFHDGRLLSQVAQDVVDRRTRFTRERRP